MPAAAVAAGVSVIGGIASARSSRKEAKKARRLARDQLNFAKQRYSDFKSLYGDIEKQLVADAKKGVVADLGGVTSRAAADVAQQFENAEGERLRNAQRLGINPNSGRAESTARQLGLGKATASALNITKNRENERRSAEEKTWQRRESVGRMGIGLMNGAADDVTRGMGNIQSIHQQNSANQAAQAGQFFGAAGSIVGMGLGSGAFKLPGSGNTTTGSGVNIDTSGWKLEPDTPPLALGFDQ